MVARGLHKRKNVNKWVAALLLLALSQVPLFAEPTHDQKDEVTPPARQSDVLRDTILRTHNTERAEAHLAPLIWDDALVEAAAQWADNLAKRGAFEHAPTGKGAMAQGENLWMGTREAFSYDEMTAMWVDEGRLVKSGRFPDVSATGDWRDVAHFTQMMWPSTKRLGCALANMADDEILVCRYYPAGNRIGDYFGVQKTKP